MKKLLAAFAVTLAAVSIGPRPRTGWAEQAPPAVEQAVEVAEPEVFVPKPMGVTWYFGSGDWGTCYRWADNDEAHMHCRTAGSGWPRVYYHTVTTWYNPTRGTYHTINGTQQSVDGSTWGPWSDGYAPSTSGYVLYRDSYYLTW